MTLPAAMRCTGNEEDVAMERNDLNVLIGGEAGQGLVTLGTALARSLVRSGYFVVVNQNYESRIRGGHNTFAIRIGTGEITSTRDSVDLLVAMDADTVALHEGDMADGGITVASAGSPGGSSGTLMVPYGELGDRRSANVAALGVVSDLLGLDGEVVAQALDDMLGKKDAKIAETNRNVLSEAVGWVSRQATEFPKLAPVASPGQRLLMHGNEAIALGALSAGVKFCAFYPMTPGTSVALNLAAQAERMGLVVEQAEDEIAAINMAIGASFAGAPSMVTTSGGGYALMAEGVSLAAMTETPVVVVVAQRPGPATGLPTRTEQADLEFVLHSGHGEFPRAIFAPGTVEECVWLTRKAFEVAARYQSPVFVLTDQFQADSYRAVEPFDFESLGPVDPGVAADAPATPYQRYAASPDGVSPRLHRRPGRAPADDGQAAGQGARCDVGSGSAGSDGGRVPRASPGHLGIESGCGAGGGHSDAVHRRAGGSPAFLAGVAAGSGAVHRGPARGGRSRLC